jgi:hypothetical protein
VFRPQIKVRDLSGARLSIEPADATSWSDVRTELIAEKKALLRSELETELSAAPDESAVETLRKDFSRKERMIEHEVDSQIHTFSATLDIDYKCVHFASRTHFSVPPPHCACDTHSPSNRLCRVLAASSPSRVVVAASLFLLPSPSLPPTTVSIRNGERGNRGSVGLEGKRGARVRSMHTRARRKVGRLKLYVRVFVTF